MTYGAQQQEEQQKTLERGNTYPADKRYLEIHSSFGAVNTVVLELAMERRVSF
jgi:hypothetical protein